MSSSMAEREYTRASATIELVSNAIAAFWRAEWATAISLAHAAEYGLAPGGQSQRFEVVRAVAEGEGKPDLDPNEIPNWLKHSDRPCPSKRISRDHAGVSIHGAIDAFRRHLPGHDLPEAVHGYMKWWDRELGDGASR